MILSSRNSDEIGFNHTPLLLANYNSKARVNINQGGTSSGKTYAILEVIILRLIQRKRLASVIGQDIPNLKRGALRDLIERVIPDNPWILKYIKRYNIGERIFYFKNGSILEFISFDDEQDAKNGKRDIAFFNEANGIEYGIYNQVAMRTSECVYIDYNPTARFWVHDKLIGSKNTVVFYSNYTHNPYCPPSVIEYLDELKVKDYDSWLVYGAGKTGKIKGLVFPHVTVVKEMPAALKNRGFGLDFGYKADPTTLIECGVMNGDEVYLDERFYARGMSAKDINIAFVNMGMTRGYYGQIYADGAEARLCDDLRERGWNVIEADKGPGSVKYGIDLLNQYKLHITEKSLNLLEERLKYRYKEDKSTGNLTNNPIDAFNHAWDAVRYWAGANLKPMAPRQAEIRTWAT